MNQSTVDAYIKKVVAADWLPTDDAGGYRGEQLFRAMYASDHAYAPYSKFKVGCCILSDNLTLHMGCNVENCMYNGMSHAELTAITNMIIHQGPDAKITEMTIWTPTPLPTASCGGCRQLIREHALNLDVTIWSYCKDPEMPPLGMTIKELLPESFGPENL